MTKGETSETGDSVGDQLQQGDKSDDNGASGQELHIQVPALGLQDEEEPHKKEGGSDTDGRQYASIDAMWKAKGITDDSSRSHIQAVWYNKAAAWYEDNCPPTVNGVLGGFASISPIDLEGSQVFLEELVSVMKETQQNLDWTKGAACECGAGIGRVTKGLLLGLGVTQVDVVESSPRLLCESPDYIGSEGAAKCRFYCQGLQEWSPPQPHKYSIVWIQWVLCYLTDTDVVAFLKRCADGLLPHGQGVIVLKENTCGGTNRENQKDGKEDDFFVVDSDDASICRSLPYWLRLIDDAGLCVIHQQIQDDFPDELFSVPMLALMKKEETDEERPLTSSCDEFQSSTDDKEVLD